MSSIVISVENLSKVYRLGQIGTGTLTNDLKVWYKLTAPEIAYGAATLVDLALRSLAGPGGTPPRVLLIAPPPLAETTAKSEYWGFGKARTTSMQLGEHYRTAASMKGVGFLDASTVAQGSALDGVHLDEATVDRRAVFDGQIARMRRRKPYPFDAFDFAYLFNQRRKIRSVMQRFAVRVHILSEKRHFHDSRIGKSADFIEDVGRRPADLTSAQIRDNAVRAEIIASLHNRHKGADLAVPGRNKNAHRAQRRMKIDPGDFLSVPGDRIDDFRKLMDVMRPSTASFSPSSWTRMNCPCTGIF